ncbi:MAG: PepSY domain-containing protein [Candidatus Eremiobacteraeota bacterium]|nr:PepSY domain-containing protein [Candidatus Eremiobacteraeota bacterium]
MNPRITTTIALVAALGATTAFAAAYPGQAMANEAHVTMAQARATALHTVRGTIKAAELERENGGSGLRYSFDIATRAGIREVGIDAKTGAVLENSSDGPANAPAQKGESGEGDGD